MTPLEEIKDRFVYTSDTTRLDHWQITKGSGPVEDDCDGYALTLAYILADKSLFRFWIDNLTFRTVIWHCTTSDGTGHAVVWRRQKGWVDNMLPSKWRDEPVHSRRFPLWGPLMFVKLLVGKFL